MKTTIYYFSATGNSLSIAQKLGKELGNTELKSISKLLGTSHKITSEKVGFVFPIYAWGIPRIVRDFLEEVSYTRTKYTFAIAGCGGIAGKSIVVVRKKLRKKGIKLNAGFVLSEPSNGINVDTKAPMHRFIESIKGNRPHQTIESRMKEISSIIRKQENSKLETDPFAVSQITNVINKLTLKIFPGQDKEYWLNDKCVGCGKCTDICPRKNITLENKKPVWHHNCELCTACLHWCPTAAIESGKLTGGKARYHKEGISYKELI